MTARKSRAVFTLLALLTVMMLLAGCGSKAQDPEEVLDTAVRAARDAGSAHARINVSMSPLEGEQGMGLNLQGDAWVDMESGTLEARFTVMGMEFSLRYVEGEAFLQIGGTWYMLEGEIAGGIDAGAVDTAVKALSSLPEIVSSTREVRELGDKKVGEYDCTVMEVVPDLQAITSMGAVRELAEELGMGEGEVLEYLEGAELSMQVCIQKDEPVIRQVFLAASVELPSLDDVVGIPLLPERARVEITMDFPEYGVEVKVQAPADATPFEGL